MAGGPIYPPHETKLYLTCPFKRYLSHRWAPKGEWTPHRLLGQALGRGIECYWTCPTPDLEDVKGQYAWSQAQETLKAGFLDQPKWTLEGLTKLLAKGLAEALGGIPGHQLWGQQETLIAAEPQGMVGRPDLITRRILDKALIVTEVKLTYGLKPQWVNKRLGEYETDHQIWHYAWEVGQFYGEEVKEVRIQLVVLTPSTKSFVYTVKPTPGRVKFWHESAQGSWNAMEFWDSQPKDETEPMIPFANWTSCNLMGGCEYKLLCHTLEGDETKAESFYESLTSEDLEPLHDDF